MMLQISGSNILSKFDPLVWMEPKRVVQSENTLGIKQLAHVEAFWSLVGKASAPFSKMVNDNKYMYVSSGSLW